MSSATQINGLDGFPKGMDEQVHFASGLADDDMDASEKLPKSSKRKRVVVVGLGMVGIAFMWEPCPNSYWFNADSDQKRETDETRHQTTRIRYCGHWG